MTSFLYSASFDYSAFPWAKPFLTCDVIWFVPRPVDLWLLTQPHLPIKTKCSIFGSVRLGGSVCSDT